MINSSNLLYVLKQEENAHIATCYGIALDKSRVLKINSPALQIITDQHILIEEADYISALILKLQELYPMIQFYNTDQDINDTKYSEFVKYKSYLGDFTKDIITTHLFDDPIYGQVIRTTAKIDIEYHTADMVKYNARRFDYHINQFLSGITTCGLKFPLTDRELTFCVHWDRKSLIGKNEYKKETNLNADKKTQYIFNSSATLVVTIYRMSSTYSVIRNILLNEDNLKETYIINDTTNNWITLK